MGYRTFMSVEVKGVSHLLGGSGETTEKVSRDMGYRSNSIATSREIGPQSYGGFGPKSPNFERSQGVQVEAPSIAIGGFSLECFRACCLAASQRATRELALVYQLPLQLLSDHLSAERRGRCLGWSSQHREANGLLSVHLPGWSLRVQYTPPISGQSH